MARHYARDVVADLLDVLGRGPAAPAHEAGARFDHAARVARHVFWGGEINLPIAYVLRKTGIGYRGDRAVRRLHELLDRFEHARGTHGAVHADGVRAPYGELLGERLGSGAVMREPVVPDGHLRDDREVGHAADGAERLVDLVQVRKGLENESVHPTRQQRRVSCRKCAKWVTQTTSSRPDVPNGFCKSCAQNHRRGRDPREGVQAGAQRGLRREDRRRPHPRR